MKNAPRINFCTLFNSNYLSRGLVLYNSLLHHCPAFHLYVFAFDDACYAYLKDRALQHVTVISLKEFEDAQLLSVKPERSAAEYCWTCTASTIRYSIRTFDLENCTYIDADMRFYSDPNILVNEMRSNSCSVLITKHNYSAAYDQSLLSGRYCVQFVTFLNDEKGMKVLEDWRNDCIDWCYARAEDGKFGDQKYLDHWQDKYEGVHELQHEGGGIAPWNLQQYRFRKTGQQVIAKRIDNGKEYAVVFFHYHGLKFFKNDIVLLTGELYDLDQESQQIFYRPYVRELNEAAASVKKAAPAIDAQGARSESPVGAMNPLLLIRYYLYDLKSSAKNIFGRTLRRRISNHYYFSSKKY
jgi:hypothetical protein